MQSQSPRLQSLQSSLGEFVLIKPMTWRNLEFMHLVGTLNCHPLTPPNNISYIFPSREEDVTGWGKRPGVLFPYCET